MYIPMCVQSNRYRQYFCACSVTLLSSVVYMHFAWPSPTIPKLCSPDSPIGVQLTKEEASWVASIVSLGMLPGAVMTGMLLDKIGRKNTLLISSITLFASWIITIFSVSLTMLLTARTIAGFGNAMTIGVMTVYIGEISEKDIRGKLLTITSLGCAVGAVVVLGIGPFVSYTTLGTICAFVPTLFCSTFPFIPESPYYLVKINRSQKAHKALRMLSSSTNADMWLKEIEVTVHHDQTSSVTFKTLFIRSNFRKALLIIIGMKTIQQFGGLMAINAYLQTILNESQTSLSSETASVIFAVIQVPCVFLSAYLVDKVGRRFLMITSSIGCAIALIGEGIYFHLQRSQDLSSIYLVPSLLLTLYYVMLAVGFGHLVYIVTGELFTTSEKRISSSVFSLYSGLLTFISIKIFNPISEAFGMEIMFWIFGVVCVLGALFGLFILPETKGKSFEEIQAVLKGEKTNTNSTSSVYTTKC